MEVGQFAAAALRPSVAAQRAQMQASLRASGDTRSSKAWLNEAVVHQQGPCGTPVARSTSLAQALLWPHSGHRQVSTAGLVGVEISDMAARWLQNTTV